MRSNKSNRQGPIPAIAQGVYEFYLIVAPKPILCCLVEMIVGK